MTKPVRAIGLMSGTSMDGIDAAMIETDGEKFVRFCASRTWPYPDDFRNRLRTSLSAAIDMTDRSARPSSLQEIERDLTLRHVAAVHMLLEAEGLCSRDCRVIGFHGHTVLHRPAPAGGLTIQLGDGRLLATETQIDVIFDLRAFDVGAGGEGAPLAPIYHRALAAHIPARPVAFLNVGGVANVTWIGEDGTLIAFDTGPGNAMADDWVKRRTGANFDVDGGLASSGKVDKKALDELLCHSFFREEPPKSLDRNSFALNPIQLLSTEDGTATLIAFTASAVARSLDYMPERPKQWVVSGGGRHNRAMMNALAEELHAPVDPAETFEINGDSVEAEAFAYMAVRSLRGLPISFPETTGVPKPLTGGVLATP